jgi:hypothetical protein
MGGRGGRRLGGDLLRAVFLGGRFFFGGLRLRGGGRRLRGGGLYTGSSDSSPSTSPPS